MHKTHPCDDVIMLRIPFLYRSSLFVSIWQIFDMAAIEFAALNIATRAKWINEQYLQIFRCHTRVTHMLTIYISAIFHVPVVTILWYHYCGMMRSSNGKIFRITGLCAENSPVICEFPSPSPVTRSFDVFFIWAWKTGWANNRDTGN